MIQPNRKFPIWIIIAIGLVFIALIAGIFLILKVHNTYHTYREDAPPVGIIITLVITAVIAMANLILVGFTKLYADQTSAMAHETKKMAEGTQLIADYNNFRWRYELMPLFLPTKKPDIDPGHKEINFYLANYGGLGLFVEIEIVEFDHKENYPKQGPHADFRIPIRNPVQKINEIKSKQQSSDSIEVTFNISFQDKETRKYKQTIKYSFTENEWSFVFDKSCLPVEIRSNL